MRIKLLSLAAISFFLGCNDIPETDSSITGQGAAGAVLGADALGHPDVFDWEFYIHEYPDLCVAGLTTETLARSHWHNNGIREGRTAHPLFSARAYLDWNADLKTAFGDAGYKAAINHYVRLGMSEGREVSGENARSPSGTCPAVKKWRVAGSSNMDKLTHGMVFDWKFYVDNHPDLCAVGINNPNRARQHWLNNGIAEGRRAHPSFNLVQYRAQDAAAAPMTNVQALHRYINVGHQSAAFDSMAPTATCASVNQSPTVTSGAGLSAGYRPPAAQQGASDIVYASSAFMGDSNKRARRLRASGEMGLGLHIYNVYWFSYEVGSSTTTPKDCPVHTVLFPANQSRRTVFKLPGIAAFAKIR